MLSALRQELNELLGAADTQRKPFLRRSLKEDFLFTTDLPRTADEAETSRVTDALTCAGWRVLRSGDLLELDRPISCPPMQALSSCGCADGLRLVSLLVRHPDGSGSDTLVRELAKAEECGGAKLDAWCARVYHDCASALRRHEPLPTDLLPYLTEALNGGSKS